MREQDKNIGAPPSERSERLQERETGADSVQQRPLPPSRPDDLAVQDHIPAAVRPTEPRPPLSVPLHLAFVARGEAVLKELNAASPDAGPEERLLCQPVADEVAIVSALLATQAQLAARLSFFIADHKQMAGISKVLRDVVLVTDSISKRVLGALAVAADFRAQRRFLANRRSSRRASRTTRTMDAMPRYHAPTQRHSPERWITDRLEECVWSLAKAVERCQGVSVMDTPLACRQPACSEVRSTVRVRNERQGVCIMHTPLACRKPSSSEARSTTRRARARIRVHGRR